MFNRGCARGGSLSASILFFTLLEGGKFGNDKGLGDFEEGRNRGKRRSWEVCACASGWGGGGEKDSAYNPLEPNERMGCEVNIETVTCYSPVVVKIIINSL